MAAPEAYVSWSSGKDSAMALWVAKCSGLIEAAGILTTTSEAYERVAIHGVREQLLTRQAAALGLPLRTVALPTPCSHELYEAKIKDAYAALFASGVQQIVFGDLFLKDLRDHRI
jgi:diphthamide synthase (EF-2-diphthine--ammonia ligase)